MGATSNTVEIHGINPNEPSIKVNANPTREGAPPSIPDGTVTPPTVGNGGINPQLSAAIQQFEADVIAGAHKGLGLVKAGLDRVDGAVTNPPTIEDAKNVMHGAVGEAVKGSYKAVDGAASMANTAVDYAAKLAHDLTHGSPS